MKKILVTGGLGFIGSNLVDKLVMNKKNEVYVIDNLVSGSINYKNPKAIYFINDIRDIINKENSDLIKKLDNLDTIYHLAALARIQESLKNPAETISVNDYGTLQIAELARIKNCKVVYASTSAIEGGYFLNPYSYSKWIGEEIFRLYYKLYNLKTAIVRFFNVYGNRHPTEGPYVTVVSVFEQQYIKNNPLTITGDGKQRRDFIHVFDICDGLIEIGKGEWDSEIFHLGTGTNLSINELSELFSHKTIYIPERKGEMMETLADISFTKSKIKWSPKIKLQDYIKNWLLEHK
ncbi:MAG: NAD-dependent epimerase/dehydratase family protein [Candidatus Lokiarchaeia archaeon]